jgi:quinol monooxygenase YgiN
MIIVTGAVVAHPDGFEALLEACLAHTARSRTEPGCLLHSVNVDCDNPLRLVFLEHWADRAALHAHFQRPESLAFMEEVRELAAGATRMAIYEAQPLKPRELAPPDDGAR